MPSFDKFAGQGGEKMIELLRTNNPVLISWLRALMAENGIEIIVLDTHTSVLEGSALAIPRRIMVADEDYAEACRLRDESAQHFAGD
jgi:hypothetical protein